MAWAYWDSELQCVMIVSRLPEGNGQVMFEVEADADPNSLYITAAGLRVKPFAPGSWAIWDDVSHNWTDPRPGTWEADQLEAAMARLRLHRDRLLAACDWTQLPDNPLTADEREAWRAYRHDLREMPRTALDPHSPTWPCPPGSMSPAQ